MVFLRNYILHSCFILHFQRETSFTTTFMVPYLKRGSALKRKFSLQQLTPLRCEAKTKIGRAASPESVPATERVENVVSTGDISTYCVILVPKINHRQGEVVLLIDNRVFFMEK